MTWAVSFCSGPSQSKHHSLDSVKLVLRLLIAPYLPVNRKAEAVARKGRPLVRWSVSVYFLLAKLKKYMSEVAIAALVISSDSLIRHLTRIIIYDMNA